MQSPTIPEVRLVSQFVGKLNRLLFQDRCHRSRDTLCEGLGPADGINRSGCRPYTRILVEIYDQLFKGCMEYDSFVRLALLLMPTVKQEILGLLVRPPPQRGSTSSRQGGHMRAGTMAIQRAISGLNGFTGFHHNATTRACATSLHMLAATGSNSHVTFALNSGVLECILRAVRIAIDGHEAGRNPSPLADSAMVNLLTTLYLLMQRSPSAQDSLVAQYFPTTLVRILESRPPLHIVRQTALCVVALTRSPPVSRDYMAYQLLVDGAVPPLIRSLVKERTIEVHQALVQLSCLPLGRRLVCDGLLDSYILPELLLLGTGTWTIPVLHLLTELAVGEVDQLLARKRLLWRVVGLVDASNIQLTCAAVRCLGSIAAGETMDTNHLADYLIAADAVPVCVGRLLYLSPRFFAGGKYERLLDQSFAPTLANFARLPGLHCQLACLFDPATLPVTHGILDRWLTCAADGVCDSTLELLQLLLCSQPMLGPLLRGGMISRTLNLMQQHPRWRVRARRVMDMISPSITTTTTSTTTAAPCVLDIFPE